MSDKKRKESHKQKRLMTEKLSEINLTPEDDLVMICVVFDNIGVGQRNYFALSNINTVCNQYLGMDISIFYQHNAAPVMQPICPIFQIKDLIGCEDPMLTTDIGTTLEALSTRSQLIYHYVYDLDFLDSYDIDINLLTSAFRDDRVKLIARCEDYAKVLRQEFYKDVAVIEDFNMTQILRKIIGEMKNERSCQNG